MEQKTKVRNTGRRVRATATSSRSRCCDHATPPPPRCLPSFATDTQQLCFGCSNLRSSTRRLCVLHVVCYRALQAHQVHSSSSLFLDFPGTTAGGLLCKTAEKPVLLIIRFFSTDSSRHRNTVKKIHHPTAARVVRFPPTSDETLAHSQNATSNYGSGYSW